MAYEGSITHWLELLRAGEREAAQALWDRFFQRFVGLARARLCGAGRAVADEEDVALSAFDSFYRRAERGQFPQLSDRNELRRLLFVITVRKAISHARREGRWTVVGLTRSELEACGADKLLDQEPTPELAAEVADECLRLLGCLGYGVLRSVATYKMEGFTNDEIAVKLACARPTVERKLRRIRSLWAEERGR